MKKLKYYFLSTLFFFVIAPSTFAENNTPDLQSQKKVITAEACDLKSQSTALELLETVFSCQNQKRATELISTIYLGNDQYDNTLEIDINAPAILIPNPLKDEVISLRQWRGNQENKLRFLDSRSLQTITELELIEPSDQYPEEFQSLSAQGEAFSIPQNYLYKTDASPELRSGTMLLLYYDNQYFLNFFEADLWKYDLNP